MVLPLRVWMNERNVDAAALAHTLDISPIGGRLGGLRSPMRPGQTITLQRGQRKAQFRVVWSRTLAPEEVQAGVEALEGGRNIWDVELPQQAHAQPQPQFRPQSLPQTLLQTEAVELEQAGGPPVTDQTADLLEELQSMQNAMSSEGSAPQAPASSPVHSHARSDRHSNSHHAASHPKMRWVAAIGMLLFVCSLGVLIRYEVFTNAKVEQPHIPAPAVPTAAELAAMTPRPIKLVPLAAADAGAGQRVQVAEAPKGRVEYPVAPEADARGKVNLKVVIATDGSVKRVLLVSGQQMLAHAAEQAVKSWHYSEHQRNGAPVEAETSVVVSFLGKDAVSLRFPSANRIVAN
jgi:TonB family protein